MQTGFGFAYIPFVEIPAFQQRNPHRSEISRRDKIHHRVRVLAFFGNVSLHQHAVAPRAARQYSGTSVSGGLHSRQRTNVFEQSPDRNCFARCRVYPFRDGV